MFFAKQDKPTTANAVSSQVPIRADIFYADNYLNTIGNPAVSIAGSTTIQPPNIKFVNKSDTTSRMFLDLPNADGVTVYFGFFEKAGLAQYVITNKDTSEVIASGEVDLHSTSDIDVVAVKGVELASGLDDSLNYLLEIKHTGNANPAIFDILEDHPIYVGDVQIHRQAVTDRSIVEFISNNAFINDSFTDDGSRNSITGRVNFVEFFNVQTDIADGITDTFKIKSATRSVRKVEVDNGRGFFELDRNIDWVLDIINPDTFESQVILEEIPKENAAIRITYDVLSFALQRKIEITQPQTYDGKYDRYNDIYVQNEAVYIEIKAEENI